MIKKERKKKENKKMSEFRKVMNELKIEKEFCIFIGWTEKAQKINSQMVQLIHENTQKMKLGIL
ncbi:hypothetical protein WRP3_035 [Lactococcus phage WRP3]|uniref:Uncharacterized protein n=2 Tax=Audreyjarvisvirus TaxID=2843351 RepID=A0A0D3MTB2_9CAUD|nr:hypothetical protein ACQ37_gp035 [Lactococcus phage WRP3]AIX12538.1 hypothetical protein WRP3_035 [Lactococcus phage WRP3]